MKAVITDTQTARLIYFQHLFFGTGVSKAGKYTSIFSIKRPTN